MPRTAAKVTQADIARVLRVATSQGMTVEVKPDGTICIVPMPAPATPVDRPKVPRL